MTHDLQIIDNTFDMVNTQPHGATVSMHTHTYDGGSPPFINIVITGNTFSQHGEAAIRLNNFTGGIIASNRFQQTARQPIELIHCSGIREERNPIAP